ncbi:carbohydrate binding family 9 domain-containing protein, partial [Candidatus Zixiibacteriota bacterium]
MKASSVNRQLIGVSLAILLFWSASPVQADYVDDPFTPVYQPELRVTQTSGEIKIDGKLDDSGWLDAARADNFAEHRPGDQTKPPVETVAFITYDEDKLYVSFTCYDDPAAIRASHAERERVFDDDNISLLLDTYGDAAWAYTMNVNPYGVQADALWSPNTGEDSGFDLIWESAGAIPFAALRFPNREQQTWKIDFYRNHPRETQRAYSWAAYDRNEQCWPCQWGTVT